MYLGLILYAHIREFLFNGFNSCPEFLLGHRVDGSKIQEGSKSISFNPGDITVAHLICLVTRPSSFALQNGACPRFTANCGPAHDGLRNPLHLTVFPNTVTRRPLIDVDGRVSQFIKHKLLDKDTIRSDKLSYAPTNCLSDCARVVAKAVIFNTPSISASVSHSLSLRFMSKPFPHFCFISKE